ncbi:unnamed protein product [Anisakis simplex]|uniref:BTB domain-containing protein n=2 Tax=Anisakis simplex TaxID=6269 RepID=A0A158PPB8_ANISI|nr:unnamed protein product [Anisakis simplex]
MDETVVERYGDDQPSCSNAGQTPDELTFQYEWIVKICKRSIGSETVILNISPAFSTAYNGVQFTWTLRLNDDCITLDCMDNNNAKDNNGVNIFLYYKDGPKLDIHIIEAIISVADNNGNVLFNDLRINDDEFTRGSGWPLRADFQKMRQLSDFMQMNVDNTVRISANIRMDSKIFSPLCYLPNVGDESNYLERECRKYLTQIENNQIVVPDLDILMKEPDLFAIHRRIFTHGCEEIARRANNKTLDNKKIINVFAHIYFNECIMPQVECFEDVLSIIEGAKYHHIPAFTREVERFICRQLISSGCELDLSKKMLLLAEHYQLSVLKMMCIGILADNILEKSNNFVNIKDDMLKLVHQITLSNLYPSLFMEGEDAVGLGSTIALEDDSVE